MIIALSASYFHVPCVRYVLLECTLIYTTQVDKRDELYAALGGPSRVKFIPSSAEAMMAFLREQHDGVAESNFITFRNLRKVVKDSLLAGNGETANLLAEYCGLDPTIPNLAEAMAKLF